MADTEVSLVQNTTQDKTYDIEDFSYSKAISGQLCAVVKILNNNTEPELPPIGTGIVKENNTGLNIIVDGVKYIFDDRGNPVSPNAFSDDYKLYLRMAVSTREGISEGSVGSTTNAYTRSYDPNTGAITYVPDESGNSHQQSIDSLNARDQFAVHALREMMHKIEDPSAVSKSEITHYVEAAYNWASYMMEESSNSRAVYVDDETTEGTEAAEVGVLEDNTEKLLNNIVAALEKTDEKSGAGSPAYWYKTGYPDVVGPYDAATASTLPREDGEPPFVSPDQAKADGWHWQAATAASYSERVSIPKLIEWLDSYSKHTPTGDGDTKTTVGLDDLINAIKEIGSSGGGGSTTVDFTTLITAINTTQTVGIRGTLPDMNIGNAGLGRDNDHPIYISGGGFPTRASLGAVFAAEAIHDLLTFNTAGAVGYSTLAETKKAVLGYLNNYADLAALYAALQPSIDNRIKAWLQAAQDADNRSLIVNTPQ